MGNEIGSGLSFKAVCFDFRSTNIGSSVIGTCSATGFDVITLYSPTLVTRGQSTILTGHKCFCFGLRYSTFPNKITYTKVLINQ